MHRARAEDVRGWVDDPGGPGEADAGDAVFGIRPWSVAVFDLDAAGAEFGYLGADVADLPRCLGLLVGGPEVPWVTSRRVPLPYLNPMAFSSFLSICRPSLPR
jgi:hypothetical protein